MIEGRKYTFTAGAAIPAYAIVKFDGNGNVVPCTADTDLMIGIADGIGDVASGDRVDVNMDGQPEVIASAAIAAGASISSSAAGTAKTAEAGDVCIAYAVQAAAAAGDIITVQIARHKI